MGAAATAPAAKANAPALARATLAGLFLLVGSAVCRAEAPAAPIACAAGSRAMKRTELIFGTARRGQKPVTDSQWSAFAREIARRFPDGWTLADARGEWRNADGRIVRERSHILILLHDLGPAADRRIEALRALYKRRFAQESVLRIDSAACVSF
jgi:hypothetical protein